MKLVDIKTAQDTTGAEIARSVMRIQASQEVEKEFRLKVIKAEQEFNETLAKHRKKWEEEEIAHNTRLVEMKREIEQAEVEKMKMLVPFDILKKGADGRFEDAETFLKRLRERESRAEELNDLLEDKLDSVGEREVNLKRKEVEILSKERGLNVSLDSFKEQSEKLTLQMKEFVAKKTKDEKEIEQRKTAVEMRELSVKSKEDLLIKKEQDLNNKERRLSDERGVLQRAWNEFNKMKQ